MLLQITLDKYPHAGEAERLAKALLILGGSDAIVSRAIEGVAIHNIVPGNIYSESAAAIFAETGNTDAIDALKPPILTQHDASNVVGYAGQAEITLPPQDDAAALLARGGVLPPPGAGTDSTPALPSSNVVAPPPDTAAPTAVRLDSAGMPYDVRIHSGAISQKKDGTWTAKRGVSELLITQIEAEHRAAGYGQAAAAPTPAPTPTPVVTPPPATEVVPPPAGVPDEAAFKALISQMGTAMSANQLAKPQIDAALAAIGLKATPELKTRPDLIETFKLHLGI